MRGEMLEVNGTFSFFIPQRDIMSHLSKNTTLESNFKDKYRKIDEIHQSLTARWFVNQGSFIFETLENFLHLNLQNGVVQHLQDRGSTVKKAHRERAVKIAKKWFETDREPKILTLFMLSAGFWVWLVSVAIACIVFFCEHIVKCVENYLLRIVSKVDIFRIM